MSETNTPVATASHQQTMKKPNPMLDTAERSFLELVKDQPGTEFNRSLLVKVLKDISAQSFNGGNIFTHPLVNSAEPVVYRELAIRNQLTCREQQNQPGALHGYEVMWDMFAIRLVSPKWSVGQNARIVVAIEPWEDNYQVGVQFFVDAAQKWVTVPCNTGTVLSTILGLFPQE